MENEGQNAPEGSITSRLKKIIFGNAFDIEDKSIFHHLALIPFLAWVGLGADGLSSSAYGPPEAFLAIGQHHILAIALALMTGFTVLLISLAYSRLIEDFPSGGGGYIVASKLIGPKAGVISGCALLIDYVLTIPMSIAAAGDAIFSLAPMHFHFFKLPVELAAILLLVILNLRGVKESVVVLVPVFLLFVFTHIVLIGAGLALGVSQLGETTAHIRQDFSNSLHGLGWAGLLLVLTRAYSLGGGTYTGIEAVSNGLPIMREPKVKTAKRTMFYMATSLSFTAAGLLIAYFLMGTIPREGMTLNAILAHQVSEGWIGGGAFVFATLISEGLILFVAAQTGFIDGPRVLANMATDGLAPKRFSALSDRLTSQNGIALMGGSALLVLLLTEGDVGKLIVMYSINVFLTFSLSMVAMLIASIRKRKQGLHWKRDTLIFSLGFLLCASILVVTSVEKFEAGGWITLTVTATVVLLAFAIQKHYRSAAKQIAAIRSPELAPLDFSGKLAPLSSIAVTQTERVQERTAIILVGGHYEIGLRTIHSVVSQFKGYFSSVLLVSVGVVDSGTFKGPAEIENLRQSIASSLARFSEILGKVGVSVQTRFAIDTDPVDGLESLCHKAAREFLNPILFSGQVIFDREQWFHGFLHNQTSFQLQKRLQKRGLTLVILPISGSGSA